MSSATSPLPAERRTIDGRAPMTLASRKQFSTLNG